MSSLDKVELTFEQEKELREWIHKAIKNSLTTKDDDVFLGEISIGKIDNPLEIGTSIISILAKGKLTDDI